jgi:hypothetical protein
VQQRGNANLRTAQQRHKQRTSALSRQRQTCQHDQQRKGCRESSSCMQHKLMQKARHACQQQRLRFMAGTPRLTRFFHSQIICTLPHMLVAHTCMTFTVATAHQPRPDCQHHKETHLPKPHTRTHLQGTQTTDMLGCLSNSVQSRPASALLPSSPYLKLCAAHVEAQAGHTLTCKQDTAATLNCQSLSLHSSIKPIASMPSACAPPGRQKLGAPLHCVCSCYAHLKLRQTDSGLNLHDPHPSLPRIVCLPR